MAAFDDEDDLFAPSDESRRARGRGADAWDGDEHPDDRDLAPDDYASIPCTHCRKLILEETIRCPYCRHMQLEDDRSRRPIWFIAVALLCVGLIGGFTLLYMLGWLVIR